MERAVVGGGGIPMVSALFGLAMERGMGEKWDMNVGGYDKVRVIMR